MVKLPEPAAATPAPAVTDEEFDELCLKAQSAGLGNFMDKDNTPSLANRLKRLLAKRKSESSP